jgi:hypothetical protein
MKTLTFLFSLLALMIYLMQRTNVHLPFWIDFYVNDFLCMPIVLGYITLLFRWLKNDDSFIFSPGFILLMACYYSFYFEYYLPKNNSRYTADLIDVFLYLLGGALFYWISLKSKSSKKVQF